MDQVIWKPSFRTHVFLDVPYLDFLEFENLSLSPLFDRFTTSYRGRTVASTNEPNTPTSTNGLPNQHQQPTKPTLKRPSKNKDKDKEMNKDTQKDKKKGRNNDDVVDATGRTAPQVQPRIVLKAKCSNPNDVVSFSVKSSKRAPIASVKGQLEHSLDLEALCASFVKRPKVMRLFVKVVADWGAESEYEVDVDLVEPKTTSRKRKLEEGSEAEVPRSTEEHVLSRNLLIYSSEG